MSVDWRRWGAVAGLGFVIVGVIELAMTGGPIPASGADAAEFADYFESNTGVGAWVGFASAIAGALLLVFAAALRDALAERDRLAARVAWSGAIVMLAAAWGAQAVQQAIWRRLDEGSTIGADPMAVLSTVVTYLFAFAVVGGGVLAAATAWATFRGARLPVWTGFIGVATLIVALVVLAVPDLGGIEFPVFVVWLTIVSIALLVTGRTEAARPDMA